MGRLGIIAAVGLALLISARAEAQQPAPAAHPDAGAPGPMVKAPGPADGTVRTAETIAPSGPPITLGVNEGTLIRLSGPANTVFVANASIADVTIKTPTLIYLTARSPGTTTLYAVDAQDRVLLRKLVRIGPNTGPVRASLDQLKSLGLGDHVEPRWLNNTLILSGTVATARRAELIRAAAAAIAGTVPGATVVDRLTIATPDQVNIRVKIAEVDRTVLKGLGIDLSRLAGRHFNLFTTPTGPNGTGLLSSEASAFQGIVGGTDELVATLRLLSDEKLSRTLAEPNLTVMNNQTASFISGGTAFIAGGTATTTPSSSAFVLTTAQPLTVPFGTQLYVTPTIIDAGHLKLHIRPVISTAPANSNGTTTISQQSAETTVELGSGETFALAGLIQDTTSEEVNKVPGLGDIPVLGQLFRSQTLDQHETELVILVTPYLVEPSRTALATPNDGLKFPSDTTSIVNGSTYRRTLPAAARGPAPPDGGLLGPAGFELN